MELPNNRGPSYAEDGAVYQPEPAFRKIRECRRRIVERTRQLQRQQHERSLSIVQRIVQEEWAPLSQEKSDAFLKGKCRTFKKTSEDDKETSDAIINSKEQAGKRRARQFPETPQAGRFQSAKGAHGVLPSKTESTEGTETLSRGPAKPRRSLSVFEQRKIEQALQEQERILIEGTPQRVAGRVHAGPSFRCRPSEVVFKVFETGGVYTQKVEVTNVSLGFSTFRVLPLPEELEGILSVHFETPGRLSAGRSTKLTVTFTPKKEEDLKSEIILLSPTGPQSLPIVCYRKRSVLSFHPPQQSAQALLKKLKLKTPAAGGVQGACSASGFNKAKSPEAGRAAAGKVESRGTPCHDGQEGESLKNGVVYLSAGDVQLGEVAAVRCQLRNTGSLPTAYHVFPVFPEKPACPGQAAEPLPEQQDEQTSFSAASLQSSREDLLADNRVSEDVIRTASADTYSRDAAEKADSLGQTEDEVKAVCAAAWLEALQDETVVLAQRLRVSAKQNSLSWSKITLEGLDGLLDKSTEGGSQGAPQPARPIAHLLKTTLVKNAAGVLDADQTQEISIVHAPTCTGRFVGFFSLQFSDPEHDEVVVVMEGECVLPLVGMDSPLHDLGICVPDRVYRQQFQVTSSSALTRTLQVVSPQAENGALWVQPARSFVQPHGQTSLTANLCLSFSFFQRHPQYVQPLPSGIAKLHPKSVAFKIPIQIRASDQILCAETAITGILTEQHLRLSSTALHFGVSDSTTRRVRLLKVTNPSLLIAYCIFRSSDRALRVLEPPHLSDLHEWVVDRQQASGGDTETPYPAAGDFIESHLLPNGSTGADAADDLPPTGDGCKPSKRAGSLALPFDSPQGTFPTFPQQDEVKEDEGWHALCQQLPLLDCGGTGLLLPGETRTFAVVLDAGELRSDAHALQLASGNAVEREGVVRMRVMLANQAAYEIKILWSATVLEAPIAVLPAPSVKLPAVPPGQRASATLELRFLAPQPSFGRGEAVGSRRQETSPETSARKATQCAGLLVEVQQPPATLSALHFTPLRVILSSKKRRASLFFSFTPTEQYVQLSEQQTATQAETASEDSCKTTAAPISSETVESRADKKSQKGSGLGREWAAQTTALSGGGKCREGIRKGAKVGGGAQGDSKTLQDKSHLQGDARPNANKGPGKSVGGGAEAGDTTTGSLTVSLETVGDGAAGACVPALVSGVGAVPSKQHSGTVGDSCKAFLLKVADAGGARWTSHEEDEKENLFDFDSPMAYHHARWFIPLKVYRLTPKQLDAYSSGEHASSFELSPDTTTTSFIEVTTCVTPPLVVASSRHVEFGSVMAGQRVYQHVMLTCSPRVLPCHHTFQALPLPLGSSFSLVSSARELAPEYPLCLTVSFQPNAARVFTADLTLVSARTRISIPLSGSGVQRTVDLIPCQDAYDMGAVVCTMQGKGAGCFSSTRYAVILRNRTSTPLAFSISRRQSYQPQLDSARAGTGLNYFACEPQRGILPGLGSVEMTVEFRPLRPEGWLKEEFELTFDADGQAPRVLTFFGLATANTLYASLPPLSSGATFLPQEAGNLSRQQRCSHCMNCSSSDAIDREDQKIFQETNENSIACLACYMESLPRLCAERGLLDSGAPGTPRHRSAGEEWNSAVKSKGSSPSHQPLQQPGISPGADKRRPEMQQIINVTFDTLASATSYQPLDGGFSVRGSAECTMPMPENKSTQESNQRQYTRTNPSPTRDEKRKTDPGALQREVDVIVENKTTRTIILGGAWAPGKQGLPPYSAVKGDASGTFEITMEPSKHSQMFAFEPAKGNLSFGSKQLVRCTFLPHAATPAVGRMCEILSRLPVGTLNPYKATATARLSLRGSTVAGTPQAQEVLIRLSAFIPL